MKKRAIRKVLLVGDTHSGSMFAPLPQPFSIEGGINIRPGATMAWMNERWERMVEWSDTPHHLVLMGDLVEGVHHRSTQMISPEPGDHFAAALALLEPLAARVHKWGGRVYVIRGTEAHSKHAEHGLGQMLGAVRDPVSRLHCWDMLRRKVCGTVCAFHHHAPTTSRPWTRGTAMSVVGSFNRLNAIEGGAEPPRVVVTAHAHVGRVYIDPAGVCVAGFSWQGLTRYGHRVVPSSTVTVGAHMLDWSEKEDGQDPEVRIFQSTVKLDPEGDL